MHLCLHVYVRVVERLVSLCCLFYYIIIVHGHMYYNPRRGNVLKHKVYNVLKAYSNPNLKIIMLLVTYNAFAFIRRGMKTKSNQGPHAYCIFRNHYEVLI